MGIILLFNINDTQKKTAISLVALRYGVHMHDVSQEQQNQTIDALLSGKGIQEVACRTPFRDEMMVMHNLTSEAFHALLDTLRVEGKSVKLKAIVTDYNRKWTALRLHQELIAEEAAIHKKRIKKK